MRLVFVSLVVMSSFATACAGVDGVRSPDPPSARLPAFAFPVVPGVPSAEPASSSSAAPTPAPPPAAPAKSCSGPADPRLTRTSVWNMLQGDDDYPHAQIVAMAPGVVPALVELASGPPNDLGRYRAITLIGAI